MFTCNQKWILVWIFENGHSMGVFRTLETSSMVMNVFAKWNKTIAKNLAKVIDGGIRMGILN
jgi:hypothetical protein